MYTRAKEILDNVESKNLYINDNKGEEDYTKAGNLFKSIRGYRDSDSLYIKCRDNIEKEHIYLSAREAFEKAKSKDDILKASEIFSSIYDYRDSHIYYMRCNKILEELEIKRSNKVTNVIRGILGLGIIIAVLWGLIEKLM